MKDANAKSLDAIFKDFTLEADPVPHKERYSITVWLSKDTAQKYEKIQAASNKKFSKKLRLLVTRAIDLIELED